MAKTLEALGMIETKGFVALVEGVDGMFSFWAGKNPDPES